MMFNLLANKPQASENEPSLYLEGAFNPDEVKQIIRLGETREYADAKVGDNILDKTIRVSRTAWIPLNDDTDWLYDRLGHCAREMNSAFYRFDLTAIADNLQYTVYDSKELSHYDWHMDIGTNNTITRKFSMVLMLSDPDEYEGGELQVWSAQKPEVFRPEKGKIIAFPSFRLHRVTPVTKGVRKSLVCWVGGPAFR